MILYHRIGILPTDERSIWVYDETLNDKVWKSVCWYLMTTDISMETLSNPTVSQSYVMVLPDPNPTEFIPFSKVDEQVFIDWIDRFAPEIYHYQKINTERLRTIL